MVAWKFGDKRIRIIIMLQPPLYEELDIIPPCFEEINKQSVHILNNNTVIITTVVHKKWVN